MDKDSGNANNAVKFNQSKILARYMLKAVVR